MGFFIGLGGCLSVVKGILTHFEPAWRGEGFWGIFLFGEDVIICLKSRGVPFGQQLIGKTVDSQGRHARIKTVKN